MTKIGSVQEIAHRIADIDHLFYYYAYLDIVAAMVSEVGRDNHIYHGLGNSGARSMVQDIRDLDRILGTC